VSERESDAAPTGREQDAIEFVLELGRSLHALGHPSHWLEEGMQRASDRLGLVGQFFTTPTSIFAAFGPSRAQRTHLLRVEPGDVNLEQLSGAIELGHEVLSGRRTPAEGTRALHALAAQPPRWGVGLTTLAFALSGAAAGRFLGGGVQEIAAAALLGLVLALLARIAALVPAFGRMFEPAAAFLVSACASGIAHFQPLSVYVATLGAILVLMPGLALTAAMSELSSQHLVSGTARLTGAGARFLGLAFAVAAGSRVAALVVGPAAHVTPPPLPGWTEWIALVLAPLAFTILLRARPRDYPWILFTGALAFVAGRAAARGFGPELGAFTGALVGASISNVLARRRGGSPATTLVPTILLLVPGSVGFRSLTLLMNRDVLPGVEAAFRMMIMLAALVAGLLMAGVVAPAPGLAEREQDATVPR
jgi:uncharacterized membrane protein YjjP (DUF1212 family)